MKGPTIIVVAVVALALVAGGLVLALGNRGEAAAGGLSDLQNQLLALSAQVEELHEANEHLEAELSQHQKLVNTLLNRVQPDEEFALGLHITGFEGTGDHAMGKNPRLEVTQGDLVRVSLTNNEAVEHDFVIDGIAHSSHLETMGATASLVFLADKAGEFPYYCSVPGHREAGMVGTLVVKAGDMGHMEAEGGHDDGDMH